MKRIHDPARLARERLIRLERQGRARAEARAVAEGIDETVELSRARGAAIAAPPAAKRRLRAQPHQRQAGLAFLAKKGRLAARQAEAGARYGQAYRRVKAEQGIRSTLDGRLSGGDAAGLSLTEVLAAGERTAQARAALSRMRRRLMGQEDLIRACDLVCGEELTPREAAGGEREAARLEAVLKVALDLLALP